MKKQDSKNVEIPTGKSIAEERSQLFDAESISKATSIDQLRSVIYETLVKLAQFDEVVVLKELQSVAKSLQKSPNSQQLQAELDDKLTKLQKQSSVKTGAYAWSSVHYQDAEYFQTVRQDLATEHKATTQTELLVIDMVTVAYFRYMRTTNAFNSFVEDNDGRREYESQTWINMMKELNKTIDSASQQMMTALTFLKELKRPPVHVKVETKQAFIANNQQINKESS